MTQNYKLSQHDYEIVAGADWPSYADYFEGKMSKRIAIEVKKIEKTFHENIVEAANELEILQQQKKQAEELDINQINKDYHSLNLTFFIKFLFFPILPATIGIWIYFYLGGTFLKFIVLFFVFRFINLMYNACTHKWLCHNQFKPKIWARPVLLFFIVFAIRSNPMFWVKTHIAHHKDQDTVLDPYPPTWGFWNNALINAKYYHRYPVRRWLVAPDIKFVLRHMLLLRLLLWTTIACIDIDIFLLSFFFIEVYHRICGGIESFTYHDGFNTKRPIDKYPYLGYFIMLFLGDGWIHKSHHDKPWVFNNSKENPKLIDIEYQLLRMFADSNTK